MEWGIRLKSNVKVLLKKTYINFLVKVFIIFILVPLVILLLSEFISRSDFQWLYDWSPTAYYSAIDLFNRMFEYGYFYIFIFILWIIALLILVYYYFKKVFSYLGSISESLDKWFDNSVEYINLPEELVDFEKKLNYLKRKSLDNEKKARENEQKKDELIVYLAHDIKTPLTSMIGYLSILDEIDDMPKKKQEKYINIALDKSYRLEELINELFDIARFNSEAIILEKEELNLNLMLEQIIDDFYPVLKEVNKKIVLNCDEDIVIFADPDKLGRVFNNLIKNAINYSSNTSDVVINVMNNNKDVFVDVINKGRQIPEEKLSRIFEKFYRLDTARGSKNGGSGLGLAIAKDIVSLHGGKISASSNEKETIFHVELPININ